MDQEIYDKYQNGGMVGKMIRCHETCAVFQGDVDGITVNYAQDGAGWLYSDAGVCIRQARDMSSPATRVYTAYVSSDGLKLVGWKGNVLARVTLSRPTPLPFGRRWSFWHGREMTLYHFCDPQGHNWWGKSSPGLAINVYRLKSK